MTVCAQTQTEYVLENNPIEVQEICINIGNNTTTINNEKIDLSNEYDMTSYEESQIYSSKEYAEEWLNENGFENVLWAGPKAFSENIFASKRILVHQSKVSSQLAQNIIANEPTGWTLLQFDSIEDTMSEYERLSETNVEVFVDPVFSLSEISDTYLDSWTGTVGYDKLQTQTQYQQRTVSVAVLDSGIENIFNTDRIIKTVNYTEEEQDELGHGTKVASVILDNTADNVKIHSYKIFDANNNTSLALINLALNQAYEDGCEVFNLSLGADDSTEQNKYGEYTYCDEIFKKIKDDGKVVVVASGNYGHSTEYAYPANSSYVWTVGAITANKNISGISNYGKIDFVSKGVSVKCLTSSGEVEKATGTSLATPYISALAAQLKGQENGIAEKEEYELIKTMCEDLGDEGYDSYYGYGLPVYTIESLCNHENTETSSTATCTASGKEAVICTDCGTTISETNVPALGHTDELIASVDVTCESDGYKMYKCSICKYIHKDVYSTTGHNWQLTSKDEPTCTTDGTGYYECSVCYSTKSETIESDGHNYSKLTTKGSCVQKTKYTYTCSGCLDVYTEEGDYDLTRHEHKQGVLVGATCQEEGYQGLICSDCQEVVEMTTIPKTTHEYVVIRVEPSCSISGYAKEICKHCGDEISNTELKATGHCYILAETVPATTKEAGHYTYKCTDCLSSYQVSIPIKGESSSDNDTSDSDASESASNNRNYLIYGEDEINSTTIVNPDGTLKKIKRKGYLFLGWIDKNGKYVTKVPKDGVSGLTASYYKINVGKVYIKSLKKKTLKISSVKKASGYQVQYCKSKKFKKNVKKVNSKKTKIKLKSLKKGMYVRVRAYTIDSTGAKIYGKWTKIKYR